jgi:hypothetical protein
LKACTGKVAERAPIAGIKYVAGVDFAGGSGQDSLALSICHFDEKENKVIVDLVREWKPPFSPSAAMKELAGIVHAYGVHTVIGDRWGGGFPREALHNCDLSFRPSDYTTSDCYLHLLPLLNSRECEIPQHPTVLVQLGALKRHTSSLGKDRVTHPANQHDDAAAALAVAVAHCRFFRTDVQWYFAPSWCSYDEFMVDFNRGNTYRPGWSCVYNPSDPHRVPTPPRGPALSHLE